MFHESLTGGFTGAAHVAPLALRPDRLLNYVWINDHPPSPDYPSPFQCSVPLTYLDRAYDNARRYADTAVRIWYDGQFMDGQSRYFLQSHAYIHAPPNVRLKDLRDIEGYDTAYGFQLRDYAWVYERADIARFMVIADGFATTQAERIFYADFDIEDVQLDNACTLSLLDRHGICMGKLVEDRGEAHMSEVGNDFAHGYIAAHRTCRTFLTEQLLPGLHAGMQEGSRICAEIRFQLYKKFSNDFDKPLEEVIAALVTDVPIPPIKAVMPPNHERYDHKSFCPSYAGREP